MHTAPRQVHVRVPATTANLGSGFDILGLALQLYNVFTMTITSDPGWRVTCHKGPACLEMIGTWCSELHARSLHVWAWLHRDCTCL